MSEKPTNPRHPILNQQGRKIKGAEPLPYEFGSEVYRLYSNGKNPFLGRTLSGTASESNLSAEQANLLFRKLEAEGAYGLGYITSDAPHRKRSIVAAVAPSTENIPRKLSNFRAVSRLPDHPERLHGRVQGFFHHTLRRLRESPQDLPQVVNELAALFQEHEIRIPVPEIFRRFRGFEPFLETLERIAEDHELENFELFCAALFGFYSQHA
jgi:hypothetical protein